MSKSAKKFLIDELDKLFGKVESGEARVCVKSVLNIQGKAGYEIDFMVGGKTVTLQFKRYASVGGVDIVLRTQVFMISYFFIEGCEEIILVEKQLAGISGGSKCT